MSEGFIGKAVLTVVIVAAAFALLLWHRHNKAKTKFGRGIGWEGDLDEMRGDTKCDERYPI